LNQKQGRAEIDKTHLLAQTGKPGEFKTRLPGGNDFYFYYHPELVSDGK